MSAMSSATSTTSSATSTSSSQHLVLDNCYDPPNIFHFIVPNAASTHILAVHEQHNHQGEFTWRLPRVIPPKNKEDSPWVNSWNGETDDLCSFTRKYLGLDLYARDIAWCRTEVPCEYEENVVVADLRGSGNVPASFVWCSLDQVSNCAWEHIHTAVDIPKLVISALKTDASILDPRGMGTMITPMWRQRWWFSDIERWFIDTLKVESLQVRPGCRLEQVRNMYYSTVLKCPVQIVGSEAAAKSICARYGKKEGDDVIVFLKTSSVRFPEALVTKAILSCLPDFVPQVLATKDMYTFIQMGVVYGRKAPESHGGIMQALADLQLRSLEFLKELEAGGVPRRGPEWVARSITEMLRHPALRPLLNKECYQTLSGQINELRTLLAELDAYNIPLTLVHGDFNDMNVFYDSESEENPVFIDWATASISHPFIDFKRITGIGWDVIEDEGSKRIYLDHWKCYESEDNITHVLDLALLLLLCENLYVLLQTTESANHVERESLTEILDGRLSHISFCIETCLKNRSKNFDSGAEVHCMLICKDSGRFVLAKQSDQKLSLPFVRAFDIGDHKVKDQHLDGHGMRTMIRSQFGLDTRVVRSQWLSIPRQPFLEKAAAISEVLDDAHDVPPGYLWVTKSDVSKFSDEPEKEQSVVKAFFEGSTIEYVVSAETPWRVFGWIQGVTKWVDQVLVSNGFRRVGMLHQVKTNQISSVWKTDVEPMRGSSVTAKDDSLRAVFLKASLHNGVEREVLLAIATFSGALVPSIIGVDPSSSAFLATDMGCAGKGVAIDWFQLMKGFGQLQVDSVAHLDLLMKAGLRKFECTWVNRNAHNLLHDSALIIEAPADGGSRSWDIEVDEVKRCMEELENLNMPLTLVHGDFHMGNVGKRGEKGYGVFDWGSAFIGHPFCDYAVMTRTTQSHCVNEEKAQNGYVAVWGEKVVNMNFERSVDLTMVYYWMVNLEVLLQMMKTVVRVDEIFIEKLIEQNLEYLNSSLQKLRQ